MKKPNGMWRSEPAVWRLPVWLQMRADVKQQKRVIATLPWAEESACRLRSPIPFQNLITGVAAIRGEDDHAFSLPVGRETAEKAFSYSRLPSHRSRDVGWGLTLPDRRKGPSPNGKAGFETCT